MSTTPRRRIVAATAAGITGLSLALTSASVATAEPDTRGAAPSASSAADRERAKPGPAAGTRGIRDAITPRGLRTHLRNLETLGERYDGRATATPGYDAAARYVAFRMRESGYAVTRDYYEYEGSEVLAESLTAGGEDVPVIAMSYTNSTPAGGVTADLVQPVGVEGCDAAAFEGFPAGAIALISRGTCSFGEKALAAGEAGAVGAVIYNNTEGDLNGTLGEATIEGSAPVGGVTQAAGAELVDVAEAGGQATLDIQVEYFDATSYNIIATSRRGNPQNEILLGAHLDGVPGTTAINDNGTGVAALLEVADKLQGRKGVKNRVRFAFWGSEEVGLIGSTAYVNQLAEESPAALGRIATYLNFDMLGSPNHIIGVYDANESKFEATAPVPAGSIETERLFRSYFAGQRQPSTDTEFNGRSDYEAFLFNGVAAGGLFTGADDVKTPYQAKVFGGTAGELLDPNYHTPEDNLANVAMGPLHTMADAIGHVALTLGRSTRSLDVPSSEGRSSTQGRQVPSGLALGDRS